MRTIESTLRGCIDRSIPYSPQLLEARRKLVKWLIDGTLEYSSREIGELQVSIVRMMVSTFLCQHKGDNAVLENREALKMSLIDYLFPVSERLRRSA